MKIRISIIFFTVVIMFVLSSCNGNRSAITSNSQLPLKVKENPVEDFEYNINKNNEIVVSKYIGKSENVVIPEKIEGYPVVLIDSISFSEKAIRSITIPNSVQTIADNAFYKCTKLEEIKFGDGITSIGDNAFDGCTTLKKLRLPSQLKSLGSQAFANCTSLEYVFIPKTAGGKGLSSFENNIALKVVEFEEGSTRVGGLFLFANCTALTEITMPKSTESLREYTFTACPNLKKVIFLGNAPKKVEEKVFGKPNKEIKIYYNKNTSGWDKCPLAEDYTLVAQ